MKRSSYWWNLHRWLLQKLSYQDYCMVAWDVEILTTSSRAVMIPTSHFHVNGYKPRFIFLLKEAILVINTSPEGHWSRRDPRWPIECSERSSVPCYNVNKAGLADYTKDHSVNGLSQWETTLQCNVVTHWLSTYSEWFLQGPMLQPMPRLLCVQWILDLVLPNLSKKNITVCLCFLSFLNIKRAQVVETLPCGRQWLVYST